MNWLLFFVFYNGLTSEPEVRKVAFFQTKESCEKVATVLRQELKYADYVACVEER